MSEVFVIEQEKLTVKLLGEVLEFNAPTSLEEEAIQERFKNFDVETSDVSVMSIYKDFFVKLGLPKEKLDLLSSKNLVALFGHAVGSKKN